MAFEIKNLGSEIVNVKTIISNCPKYWIYFNEAGDTVTAAGFIPDTVVASVGIQAGDRIRVIPATLTQKDVEYHAVISNGQLTLTAFAA